jgi:hypothetical protein
MRERDEYHPIVPRRGRRTAFAEGTLMRLRALFRRVVGIPSRREAIRQAFRTARERRERVRDLAGRSFSDVDKQLGVSDVGSEVPASGYVTPRHYPKREPLPEAEARRAEEALAGR